MDGRVEMEGWLVESNRRSRLGVGGDRGGRVVLRVSCVRGWHSINQNDTLINVTVRCVVSQRLLRAMKVLEAQARGHLDKEFCKRGGNALTNRWPHVLSRSVW